MASSVFRLVAVTVLSTAVVAAEAQFRSAVDLVPVYATVTARDGSFVAGLSKDDFVVTDDGKPQEIVSFAEEAQSISAFVIMDTSGSMVQAMPQLFGAAGVFLDNLRPTDRAMISSLVYQGPQFTSDKNRLRTSMDMVPKDPWSPVWFALDRAVSALKSETNRRVIVIYSDGENGNSEFKAMNVDESKVRDRLVSEAVMVYAIGFEGVPLGKALKAIARKSGGRATELSKSDDLAAVLRGIADELHHQYLLGFTPAVFDDKQHKLTVTLKKPDLTIRARDAYVASKVPNPPQQRAGR